VYYIPQGNAMNFHRRVEVKNDETLAAYLKLPRPRPRLFVFRSDSDGRLSPLENPQDNDAAAPAPSSSSRGTAQTHFAEAVCGRDGACCACGKKETHNLAAAHLIPVSGFFSEKLAQSGLRNVFDTRNGIALCLSCHSFFDHGYWCVKDGKFFVSQSLQGHNDDWKGRHELPFPSSEVSVEQVNWPIAEVWAVRELFYETKVRHRHDRADSKEFRCGKCGKGYKTQGKHFLNHVGSCREHALVLFTDKSRRWASRLDTDGEVEEARQLAEEFATDCKGVPARLQSDPASLDGGGDFGDGDGGGFGDGDGGGF
jgi:hypothetical protein